MIDRARWIDDSRMLAPPRVLVERRDDDSFILRSADVLQASQHSIGTWLEQWSTKTPHVTYLAERDEAGWRKLTYREVREEVGGLAQGLIDLQLPAGKPVVCLSDNSIDQALLILACHYVGRPVCAVSSAYSRSKDLTKISSILRVLQPALVYASNASVYGPALTAWGGRAQTVFSREAEQFPGAISFLSLQRPETADVAKALTRVQPEDHAKYMLTSGSTGAPKIVVNTHAMLCANQQSIAQVWRFLEVEKPVVVDWLPWSHTFGANHNFNLVLRNGGTLYIDDGRPMPGAIERTLSNVRDVQPNLMFNVPRGYDAMLPYLEADAELAAACLSNLRMLFYAAAALPQSLWQRLQSVARRVRSEPLWMTTEWGASETAPAVTSAHWWLDGANCIGLPMPGSEIKFVPNGGKLEMRVRGASVFPGYLNDSHLTAKAFDEEGFYRIGDAGYLLDPGRPELGIVFNGRVAEDFKLSSGTWVSVGTLRLRSVAALTPLAQDVVVAGHDRADVSILIFPSPQARSIPEAELRHVIRERLTKLREEGSGSSQCPMRALVLWEAPSFEDGEITDKGYINQRTVLERRHSSVAKLYADAPDADVIQILES
jgi:feruloyl-CoA synthase